MRSISQQWAAEQLDRERDGVQMHGVVPTTNPPITPLSKFEQKHGYRENVPMPSIPPLPEDKCVELRKKVIKREELFSRYNRMQRLILRLAKQSMECIKRADEIKEECKAIERFDGHLRLDIGFQLWGNPNNDEACTYNYTLPGFIGKSHQREAIRSYRMNRFRDFDTGEVSDADSKSQS